MFTAECAPHKLDTAWCKCLTFSRTSALAAAAAAQLQFTPREDDVVVVGTPGGTDAFVRAHATSKAEKAVELIGTILDLPLASQDQMLLLRMSLSRRFAHLPRSVPFNLISGVFETPVEYAL